MLQPTEAGFEWLKNSPDVKSYHGKVLAYIRALYDAYLEGELFQFAKEELDFLDKFVRKPTSQITSDDLKEFIALIKSDKQLLKFAEEQGLIHLQLSNNMTKIDANGETDGLASTLCES